MNLLIFVKNYPKNQFVFLVTLGNKRLYTSLNRKGQFRRSYLLKILGLY